MDSPPDSLPDDEKAALQRPEYQRIYAAARRLAASIREQDANPQSDDGGLSEYGLKGSDLEPVAEFCAAIRRPLDDAAARTLYALIAQVVRGRGETEGVGAIYGDVGAECATGERGHEKRRAFYTALLVVAADLERDATTDWQSRGSRRRQNPGGGKTKTPGRA